ncbi:MAG: class I SAM-dependent methyltransferase [Leptospira sp.]|nr:class I SAM-dependent methyltransferase [Leptospira sp.]
MNDFYLDSLSLQEEIPRLASLTRVTYPVIKTFLEKFPPPTSSSNKVYLDIGCGTGILTGLLKEQFPGYTMYGLDRSQDLINFAQITHPTLHWLNENIYSSSFADRSIDYALTHFTIKHIPDLEKAISEIHRILNIGGFFLMIEPDLSASDVDPLFKDLFTRHAEITNARLDTFNVTKPFLDKHGFKPIQDETFLIKSTGKNNDMPSHDYPNISIGRMAIWSIFSYMGQLIQLREIYNECVEKYMKKEITIRNIKLTVNLLQKVS